MRFVCVICDPCARAPLCLACVPAPPVSLYRLFTGKTRNFFILFVSFQVRAREGASFRLF
jgi:hypothetical protein